jgi:hypothetical protein
MKRIPLTQGKFALVDNADFEYLSQFTWHVVRDKTTNYARRSFTNRQGKQKFMLMHRELMGNPVGRVVHHRNENGQDNRRNNLSILTVSRHHRHHNRRHSTKYFVKSMLLSKIRKSEIFFRR